MIFRGGALTRASSLFPIPATSNLFALAGAAFALLAKGIAVVHQGLRPIPDRIAACGKPCRVPAHGFGEAPIDSGRSPKPIGE
ncbi:MAG: hypothetical protein ACJ76J_09880 [Thermoanaerobaculia bacterium]